MLQGVDFTNFSTGPEPGWTDKRGRPPRGQDRGRGRPRDTLLATNFAVLMPMAKHNPCAPMMVAVFTPTTRPSDVTSGPPELPGFKDASVWMTSSINRPEYERSERPSALTTPAVTVYWNP